MKNKQHSKVGNVGFYKQDPGGKKSPNLVLSERDGKLEVFEIPTQLTFNIDVDEWMDLAEMRSSTLAILNGKHDDTTIAILRGRVEALADAQQFIVDRFEMHQQDDSQAISKLSKRVFSLAQDYESAVALVKSLAAGLEKAKQALQNVPMVGEVYDQQHSDTHMAASVEIEMLAGQVAVSGNDYFDFSDKDVLPTTVIEMDCGAIHCVRSSVPMRIIMLDADTDGAERENIAKVNGSKVYVHDYVMATPSVWGSNGIDLEFVANVLPQIKKKAAHHDRTNDTEGFAIKARAHSDDRVFEAEFDAVIWFEDATDDQIRELAKIGWGGDSAANEVAQFCKVSNQALVNMFCYLSLGRIAGAQKGCEFECTVDRASVKDWLNKFRPHLVEEFESRDIL